MKVIPLYSKVFYTDILNIDDKYFNNIKNSVKNFDYKKTNDVDNPSLINEDFKILNKPEFKLLGDIILKSFTDFTKEQLKISNDFKISSSWLTKTEPNHHSNYHRHNNCYYSGVFYIETAEDGGEIMFDNMADERFMLNKIEDNTYNTRNFIFKTKNKMIMFFPSDIHHKISKNKTNNDRYSVAFNFYPIGQIGEFDSNVKLS